MIDQYDENNISTCGLDYLTKEVDINGTKFKVKLWDSAGQEMYHNLAKNYFHKCEGILIVFDICDKRTFDHLNYWIQEIEENTNSNHLTQIVIVGNKSDLEDKRQVSREEGEKYASDHSLKYFEISAKDNIGINALMTSLLTDIVKTKEKYGNDENYNEKIELKNAKNKGNKKGNCCK